MATAKKAAPTKVAAKTNKVPRKSPWTYSVDGEEITFSKNDHEICTFNLENVENLTNSCGLKEIDGISYLEVLMEDNGIPQRVVKAALAELIDELKDGDAAYIIASNNEETPVVNRMLDSLCVTKTPWRNNPNSGNNIRVWCL